MKPASSILITLSASCMRPHQELTWRYLTSLGDARSAVILLLLLVATPTLAEDAPLYRSSVVGMDFDFITEGDPDTFVRLEDEGQGKAEMPDKSNRFVPLMQQAFLFDAHFNDGTRVRLVIDADFKTQDRAREQAGRIGFVGA